MDLETQRFKVKHLWGEVKKRKKNNNSEGNTKIRELDYAT